MKPSILANLLSGLGSVCLLAGVLEKPLGLPEWAGYVAPIAGAALIWSAVAMLRRAKQRGDISAPTLTREQYHRRMALLIVLIALVSLTSPIYAPYLGIALPLGARILCAVITFAIGATAIVFGMRRLRPER